jgi:pyruvate,water dikinase
MSLDVLDPRSLRAGERSLASTLVPSRPASRLLAVGLGVGAKTVTGRARYVARPQDLDALQPGEILMAEETAPAWEPALARAAGVVVNRGDEASHAALAARRLGVPAVVAAHDGASPLWTGAVITLVAGADGSGRIYQELAHPAARDLLRA